MQFKYTLEYRDQLEATRAGFAGDPRPPVPRPASQALLALVAVVALVVTIRALVARCPSALRASVPTAVTTDPDFQTPDPMEHPVFGAGAVVAALGGALYVVPLAYLLGMRRAARPLHDTPVTVRLDDDGLAIDSDVKHFSLGWEGVLAVVETKTLFVLKTVSDMRLALPKRALRDGDEVNALRTLLHGRVAPVAGVVGR